jgi:hypothetical protein
MYTVGQKGKHQMAGHTGNGKTIDIVNFKYQLKVPIDFYYYGEWK